MLRTPENSWQTQSANWKSALTKSYLYTRRCKLTWVSETAIICPSRTHILRSHPPALVFTGICYGSTKDHQWRGDDCWADHIRSCVHFKDSYSHKFMYFRWSEMNIQFFLLCRMRWCCMSLKCWRPPIRVVHLWEAEAWSAPCVTLLYGMPNCQQFASSLLSWPCYLNIRVFESQLVVSA